MAALLEDGTLSKKTNLNSLLFILDLSKKITAGSLRFEEHLQGFPTSQNVKLQKMQYLEMEDKDGVAPAP